MKLTDILNRLSNVSGRDGQYSARCPAYDDRRNSLSISTGVDGRILLHCHAGCEVGAICKELGIDPGDLFNTDDYFPAYATHKKNRPALVATYKYMNGAEKQRFADKSFTWRHKDGGKWVYNRKGLDRCLYVAGELKSPVFIVEGEKDADNLHELGYNAASGEDGAGPGKWRPEYTKQLDGLVCAVFNDNDDIGREYANETAAALTAAGNDVYMVDLVNVWPDMPPHGDVSDMIDRYGPTHAAELITKVLQAAPRYGTEDPPDAITLSIITARDLQAADLPPAIFIIPGLLSAGLASLVSPPKYGKSWYVLQMCLSVAAGLPFMNYPTEQGACLYLALEDTPRRLQDRMEKLLQGKQAPDGLSFATSAKTIDKGLIEELESYVKATPACKLIVIDTLQRVRGPSKPNISAYEADYMTMTPLKEFADRNKLCVLLVHHLRKLRDESDPFNMISGTNGILGALDTAIVMTREKRGADDTLMSVTGRDVESQDKIIWFDRETCTWKVRGDADVIAEQRAREEYDRSPIVKTIKGLLKQSPGGRWDGTAKDLLEAGKYIAKTYLASTLQKLGHEIKALDRPLYDYDRIIHETTKANGNGGKRHCFYYAEIPGAVFEDVDGQKEIPFPG